MLVWKTQVTAGRPVDLFACADCGHVMAEEDWHVPSRSPRINACRNCGGVRRDARCVDCGLTVAEDFQVHDQLRQLIDRDASMLDAARMAVAGGRRLLGLKLASAAVHEREDADEARALRVRLLLELEAVEAAIADCRDWTVEGGAESALAWSLYGDAHLANKEGTRAIDHYERALELDPKLYEVRARLTRCLLAIGRFARGRAAALQVIQDAPEDSEAAAECLELMGLYASRLIARNDHAAAVELLEVLGDAVERNGTLQLAVAWRAQQLGKGREVKRALKLARKLGADPHLLEDAEAAMGGRRWGWLSWT